MGALSKLRAKWTKDPKDTTQKTPNKGPLKLQKEILKDSQKCSPSNAFQGATKGTSKDHSRTIHEGFANGPPEVSPERAP